MTEQPDPFADFTFDELLAIHYLREGAEFLEALVAAFVSEKTSEKFLLQAGLKLEKAGLGEAAAIVLKASDQLWEEVSPEVIEILEDENRANVRACLASLNRTRRLSPADWSFLEELDQKDLDFVARANPLGVRRGRREFYEFEPQH